VASDAGGGEDVDDVSSDDGSLDDFIAADDEDVGGEAIDHEEMTEGTDPNPMPAAKRKAATQPSRQHKRQRVVQQVPYVKGPMWEEDIGKCQWEGFAPYKIQFFNGVHFPFI
jgi:chromatin assembly factor 1 subunit A